MRPTALLKVALRSLRRNKLRTFLTMLGIIIGVAAVIAMLAVGEGARTSVESSIASLGTNVINVYPGGQRGPGGARGEAGASGRFTEEDVEAIRKEAREVRYISPIARSSAQLKYGGQNWRSSVWGAYPEYLQIRQWDLESGSPLSASEERGAAKVCLLGKTVATNLFGDEDPVGRTVRILNLPFRVAGVLQAKGQNSFGQDQDDIVIAPSPPCSGRSRVPPASRASSPRRCRKRPCPRLPRAWRRSCGAACASPTATRRGSASAPRWSSRRP
jgi:putative ABC transport system permease protein